MEWEVKEKKSIVVSFIDQESPRVKIELKSWSKKTREKEKVVQQIKDILKPLAEFSQTLANNIIESSNASIEIRASQQIKAYLHSFNAEYIVIIKQENETKTVKFPLAEIYSYAASSQSQYHAEQLASLILESPPEKDIVEQIADIIKQQFPRHNINVVPTQSTYHDNISFHYKGVRFRFNIYDPHNIHFHAESLDYRNPDPYDINVRTNRSYYFLIRNPEFIIDFVKTAVKSKQIADKLAKMIALLTFTVPSFSAVLKPSYSVVVFDFYHPIYTILRLKIEDMQNADVESIAMKIFDKYARIYKKRMQT